jgi:hypothetical protein
MLHGELVKFRPRGRGLANAPRDRLGLHVVSSKTERQPEMGVIARPPGSVPGMGERAVVVLCIGAEPLLDAREPALPDIRAGEHERRQGPGHPAVAVTKRMDHDQVQVRHRGADDRIAAVAGVQAGRQGLHQRRDIGRVRSLVDDLVAALVVDVDGSLAVPAR